MEIWVDDEGFRIPSEELKPDAQFLENTKYSAVLEYLVRN